MTTNLDSPLPDFVAWVIIADEEIDKICGSLADAKRECKDLRAMGCTVKRIAFGTWAEAEAFADRWREND